MPAEIPSTDSKQLRKGASLPTVKPGAKTTEFWLTLVAQASGILTLFTGVDVSGPAQGAVKAVGAAVVALASLGYAISRGLTKKGALEGTTPTTPV
jgi:hypothetical protein